MYATNYSRQSEWMRSNGDDESYGSKGHWLQNDEIETELVHQRVQLSYFIIWKILWKP